MQRHLQIRIEAQGKYLQSILDKACKALRVEDMGSAGLETAREEFSKLAIKVGSECDGITSLPSNGKGMVLNGSLVTLAPQAVALKKRPRTFFGSGDPSPFEGNMQAAEWTTANTG